MNGEGSVRSKKKMKTWLKVLLIVLLSVLGLMLAAAIALYAVFSHYYNKVEYVPDDHTETIVYDIEEEPEDTDSPTTETVTDAEGNQLPPVTEDPKVEEEIKGEIDQNVSTDGETIKVGKNVRNILLIGTDGRTVNERGRSDSMILLTINENTKEITMTSLMRDMYVYIPQVQTYNRINASYAHGGVPLLLETIERNFKLEIDQYVRVNFDSFKYIIDTMGGIDIELSQAEIDYLKLTGKAQQGVVHLNGEKALAYCRCRHVSKGDLSGDFARTARQREFLEIMSQKLKGMSIAELTELLDVFLPYVATNLKQSDMLSLLANCPKYLTYEIKSERLPIEGSWKYAKISGKSVLSVNFKKNIQFLEELMSD